MNEELDYAEMLEIPVSTVNVVKKKSIFKRKAAKNQPQPQEDLKERVVESVNERVGAYVYSEDLSDPPKPEKRSKTATVTRNDRASKIIFTEAVVVALIAIAIFVTNLLLPNTVINTFLSSFSATTEEEPAYTEFTLSSVVGNFSDAEVSVSDSGVLSFTAEGSVYPICNGTVSSVSEKNGLYTVEIAHTSTFKSVITGLTNVYSAVGTKVRSNIPVAYSNGDSEVRVTMYDKDAVLNCYSLSGEIPVWKS